MTEKMEEEILKIEEKTRKKIEKSVDDIDSLEFINEKLMAAKNVEYNLTDTYIDEFNLHHGIISTELKGVKLIMQNVIDSEKGLNAVYEVFKTDTKVVSDAIIEIVKKKEGKIYENLGTYIEKINDLLVEIKKSLDKMGPISGPLNVVQAAYTDELAKIKGYVVSLDKETSKMFNKIDDILDSLDLKIEIIKRSVLIEKDENRRIVRKAARIKQIRYENAEIEKRKKERKDRKEKREEKNRAKIITNFKESFKDFIKDWSRTKDFDAYKDKLKLIKGVVTDSIKGIVEDNYDSKEFYKKRMEIQNSILIIDHFFMQLASFPLKNLTDSEKESLYDNDYYTALDEVPAKTITDLDSEKKNREAQAKNELDALERAEELLKMTDKERKDYKEKNPLIATTRRYHKSLDEPEIEETLGQYESDGELSQYESDGDYNYDDEKLETLDQLESDGEYDNYNSDDYDSDDY